jgi:hypothetical protein
MPGREPVEVTVESDGQELTAGTLWVHERGGQTASFRYADSYVTRPGSYPLDPLLPVEAGVFHTPQGRLCSTRSPMARPCSRPATGTAKLSRDRRGDRALLTHC